jgi:hypothetical protein
MRVTLDKAQKSVIIKAYLKLFLWRIVMKRVLFFVLVLTLAAGAVFGDDAKTMPKMVGRLWLAPTFVFAPGEYDTDGNYKGYGSGDGAVKMLNLGFALEYGVIDWITAAIQWAPGVTVWSDMDGKVPISMTAMSDSSVNLNGVADLFVGAKVQIAGEKAPLKTDRLRLAIGPGVKIPLPGQDFEDQLANANKKDTVTALNLDKHVFGFGARVYFDYILTSTSLSTSTTKRSFILSKGRLTRQVMVST